MGLGSRVALRFCLSLAVSLAMLFLPAGTWRFWEAWVLLAVVYFYLVGALLYFYKHDPELLKRRMQGKEKLAEQERLVALWWPVFGVALLLPGFDYRFGWSRAWFGGVPAWLVLLADAVSLGALLFVFWVMRVNSFASRTIQVEAKQRVISSGPYALVRHPMYLGAAIMWLFLPLGLGSYVALPAFALEIPFYIVRLLAEEKFLRRELPGYADYCVRTRFRLVPYVW